MPFLRSALLRNTALALSALILAVLAVAVWRLQRDESSPLSAPVSQGDPVERQESIGESGEPPSGARPSMAGDLSDDIGLKPGDVIGNPKCRMLAGRDAARDTALVVVPEDSGTRLAVLGGNGLVYEASLPFVPHHLQLGKRVDGSVVAGVGDLRLGSRVFREPHTIEPVRIFQDGRVLYETEKAWDFGIASDGSSFYVHEPLAGDASRLVVRNLDDGTETHIDLGTAYSTNNAYDSGYSVGYANGAKEIAFKKGGDYGRGLYRFYSVSGEDVRTIRVGRTFAAIADAVADIVVDDNALAQIVSSEEGYFAYPPTKSAATGTPEPWRIVRRRFGYGDEPGATDEWSLDIGLAGYGGTMIPSDDGRWLGLKAWDFVLLNATTGGTVFQFPQVDKTAQLARLASVMDEEATVADVGSVTSYSFRGEKLMLYRQIGSTLSCSGRAWNNLEDYYKCVADLRRRGLYRTVIDVFDLAVIEMDSQPQFRVDFDERDQCAVGDFPLRGLEVLDGQLAFLPERR